MRWAKAGSCAMAPKITSALTCSNRPSSTNCAITGHGRRRNITASAKLWLGCRISITFSVPFCAVSASLTLPYTTRYMPSQGSPFWKITCPFWPRTSRVPGTSASRCASDSCWNSG
ncbi:hypothetical protein D3C85_1418600 [compost metagenome]